MGFLVRRPLSFYSFISVDLHRIVAMVVGFGFALLFLFVPETFWDRTPRPKSRRPTVRRSFPSLVHHPLHITKSSQPQNVPGDPAVAEANIEKNMTPRQYLLHRQNTRARFEDVPLDEHN